MHGSRKDVVETLNRIANGIFETSDEIYKIRLGQKRLLVARLQNDARDLNELADDVKHFVVEE